MLELMKILNILHPATRQEVIKTKFIHKVGVFNSLGYLHLIQVDMRVRRGSFFPHCVWIKLKLAGEERGREILPRQFRRGCRGSLPGLPRPASSHSGHVVRGRQKPQWPR